MNIQTDIQNKNPDLPEGPVRRLIGYTEDLTDMIRREISILEERRPSEIGPLQAEKAQLSAIYQEEFEALKKNQQLLGAKDSPLRLRLREATEIFNAELIRLGRILLQMKSVTEGMVQSIVEEVGQKRQQLRNYSPEASVTESGSAKPLPIALNEVV